MEQQRKKTFKNRNIFGYLGNILCGKSTELYSRHIAEDGFDSDFKKVVLLRYLSMSPDERIREIVFKNQLLFDRTDSKTLYRYLLKVVPRQKSEFIKYIK